MTDINELLSRIDAHIAKTEAAQSTVSRKLFGNGKRLDEIRKGGSITLRKWDQVKAALSDLEASA